MKTLWIALRALCYAACGTFLFIGFVVATRGFDRRFEAEFTPWTRAPRLLLTALGAILMPLCMGTFVIRGRGTPLVLDAPREFVASGPYRVLRNLLYIGSTTFLPGMACIFVRFPSCYSPRVGPFFVHLFVVYLEEPDLKRKFGPTYEAYRAAVPRWIPSVGRPKRTQ